MPQPVASAHNGQTSKVLEATRALCLQGEKPLPWSVRLVTTAFCYTLLLFFLNYNLYFFELFLQFAEIVSNSCPALPSACNPSQLAGACGWKMYLLLSFT